MPGGVVGDAKKARLANDAALARIPKVSGGNGQIYLSQPLAKVFNTAEEAAKKAIVADHWCGGSLEAQRKTTPCVA